MENAQADDVELELDLEPEPDPPAPEAASDPAAEAFARLEGELALMRRAVQHLAAERADIVIPDYGTTLTDMAKRLGAISRGINTIADHPAMQLTPDSLGRALKPWRNRRGDRITTESNRHGRTWTMRRGTCALSPHRREQQASSVSSSSRWQVAVCSPGYSSGHSFPAPSPAPCQIAGTGRSASLPGWLAHLRYGTREHG